MMLMRRVTNNGYWCGCCHNEWEHCEWVDDITPEQFIYLVYAEHECDNFQGVSYEREGEVVYTCRVDGGKGFEFWKLIKPNGETLPIYSWHRSANLKQIKCSREEALAWLVED